MICKTAAFRSTKSGSAYTFCVALLTKWSFQCSSSNIAGTNHGTEDQLHSSDIWLICINTLRPSDAYIVDHGGAVNLCFQPVSMRGFGGALRHDHHVNGKFDAHERRHILAMTLSSLADDTLAYTSIKWATHDDHGNREEHECSKCLMCSKLLQSVLKSSFIRVYLGLGLGLCIRVGCYSLTSDRTSP
jgi:hypothetical protein